MKLVNWTEGVKMVETFQLNLEQDRELSKKYYSIVGVNGREEEAKALWTEMRKLWKERKEMMG